MKAGYDVFAQLFLTIFRIFHCLPSFFNQVIKLLRSRGIEGTAPGLYPFIKNMFRVDVINQSFNGLKQSQIFFVH